MCCPQIREENNKGRLFKNVKMYNIIIPLYLIILNFVGHDKINS